MPSKVAEQMVEAAYFDVSNAVNLAGWPHFRLEIIGLFYGFPFPARYRPNRLLRMILYGFRGAHLRTAPLPGTTCPACATPDAVKASVYSRYAHVYYIPFFPFSKAAVAQCTHCQQAWEEKTLSSELRPAVRELKKSTRFPLWNWAGIGVVVLGLAAASIAGRYHARDRKAWLAAPHTGDIYTVHSPGDSTKYSLLKVVSANGNTVEVVGNDYETDDSSPVTELNSPEKYGKESQSLTVLDLQIMHNKGQLTDVDRLEK
jgi:hypothetical protein